MGFSSIPKARGLCLSPLPPHVRSVPVPGHDNRGAKVPSLTGWDPIRTSVVLSAFFFFLGLLLCSSSRAKKPADVEDRARRASLPSLARFVLVPTGRRPKRLVPRSFCSPFSSRSVDQLRPLSAGGLSLSVKRPILIDVAHGLLQVRYRSKKQSLPGRAFTIPVIGNFLDSMNPSLEHYKKGWAVGDLSVASVFHMCVLVCGTRRRGRTRRQTKTDAPSGQFQLHCHGVFEPVYPQDL